MLPPGFQAEKTHLPLLKILTKLSIAQKNIVRKNTIDMKINKLHSLHNWTIMISTSPEEPTT